MNSTAVRGEAASYHQRGWCPIPVKESSKEPALIELRPYLNKPATKEELSTWTWPGVGIVTGPVSDLLVLDVDGPEGEAILTEHGHPITPMVKTGGGGLHLYFRHPEVDVRTGIRVAPGLDVKASGGYVVAPPSVGPAGKPYEWIIGPEDAAPATVPEWLMQLIEQPRRNGAARPVGDQIPGGQRNRTLTSLAGSMRRRGMGEAEIAAALEVANKRRCNPPLEDEEVQKIACSVARYEPAGGGDPPNLGHRGGDSPGGFNLTDLGNAERFVAQHGANTRFCYPWGKWLTYTGPRWEIDDAGRVHKLAKETVRSIYPEAADAEDEGLRKAIAQHATRSEAEARIRAMIELAKSEVPVSPDELDADPWLLNVPNGTVNLRTGELRPHRREDLITKIAPVEYDPAAATPAWEAFLERVLPNEELRSFVQRASGYSTTGNTSEQCMFINHGIGANGKSTFQEAIAAALGDYSMRAPTEMLMAKRSGGVPNDVARLKGARFVSASETEQGRHLAESLVKDLTGTDTITARFMRAEFFDFKPTHKLWLSTNHKPLIRGTDLAIWRRLRLVPWAVTIPPQEQDKQLPSRLQDELPGILSWIVRGCLDWRREGLAVPDEVREATGAYRAEMDTLGEFLEDRCVVDPDTSVAFNNLWKAYREWCLDTEEKGESKKQFGMSLTERGFVADKGSRGVRVRRGLRLKEDSDPDPGRRSAAGVADDPTCATQEISCKPTENRNGVAHGGSDLHINKNESASRGVNAESEPHAPHAPHAPVSFDLKPGESATVGELQTRREQKEANPLAEFLEDPPAWFRKQAASCAEQGSPERLVKPLLCSTSYALFGTADRHQEVRPAVESWLGRVGDV